MAGLDAETGLSTAVLAEHERLARQLVEEAHANDGLAPVDLDRFWEDQERAADPFGAAIPQTALGLMMSHECVFDELGIAEDWWRLETDLEWRASLCRAYNDRAEKIVGRRLLNERPRDATRVWPRTKALHDLFEAKNVWHDNSWWLMPAASGESELSALLDRVEKRLDGDMKRFVLPDNWDAEKRRLLSLGAKPPLYRWQRGPVTFATSLIGTEDLLLLILDNPELAVRLRDLILRGILAIARVLDEEAGFTPQTSPRGFGFADDNCALLTPDMYELFGLPVLQGVFAVYSPGPTDWRYQHSDSAMGHLLPLLARARLRGVNFGPTVTVSRIRRHLPDAIIEGQLAPFTLSRNDEVGIVRECLRDIAQARPARGLRFTTAGSVNNGSRLTGLRLIMSAIQRHGRFD